ncbi:MAG TPA: hypothetical protein VH062_05595 [Polyangiaceae bacterium]|nr:hypothetical protein [Polyangiaceae bacterium]
MSQAVEPPVADDELRGDEFAEGGTDFGGAGVWAKARVVTAREAVMRGNSVRLGQPPRQWRQSEQSRSDCFLGTCRQIGGVEGCR